MKVRIISSLVGLALLALVYAFLDTLVLNAVIALITVMAVTELLGATGCAQFRALTALSVLLSLLIVFARVGVFWHFLSGALFVVILLFFILLIKNHATMRIEHFAMAFLFSTVVPLFFSCAVYLRDDHGPMLGGLYLLLALGSAWLCDTGAYFTGTLCGKHRMAPTISPKKTWEGAVGGVVVCTVCLALVAMLYAAWMGYLGAVMRIRYLQLCLLTPVFAVVGMLGDLSASVIKRAFDVKDFGSIMPGHGGIMDRFDSVLFTLPTVYATVRYLPLAEMVELV